MIVSKDIAEISDCALRNSVRINGLQFWLYAAVGPETNKFLHLRLFTTTTTALTQRFLYELRQKHDVEDAEFFVNHAQHLAAVLR